MLKTGSSAVLTDNAGTIADGPGACQVLCIALKTALVGTLTLSNLTQPSGANVPWVIPSTTTGVVLPPAPSLGTAYALSYAYSNPVDAGKAIAAWIST
ncbi:MAG: hypothetical protein H7255_00960 [Ramlibacter sp.]|nr:hypothetical protein [Ramlibacter sp.]